LLTGNSSNSTVVVRTGRAGRTPGLCAGDAAERAGFAGAFKLEARRNYFKESYLRTHASCPTGSRNTASLGAGPKSRQSYRSIESDTCNCSAQLVSAQCVLSGGVGAQSDALAQLLTDARSIARALCSLSVCGLLLAACYTTRPPHRKCRGRVGDFSNIQHQRQWRRRPSI
uniref:Integron gene cassette protein n=1 Tax=Macrostomum lignano TaxID=282301 RepID=A0A1I8FCS3_9PLAT